MSVLLLRVEVRDEDEPEREELADELVGYARHDLGLSVIGREWDESYQPPACWCGVGIHDCGAP